MANILDYIIWRGDLSFKKAELNEVDSLILSRFSYFPLDELFMEDKKITIQEAYNRFLNIGIGEKKLLQIDDKDLFPALANSKRFGELHITNYINKIDKEAEKQFSAVTIILPDNTVYISYRGTDNTLVGWKEDFNLSFDSDVPSQHDAVEYVENVAKKTKKKIRIGGHSKGGNLAVYAAIFCEDKIKDRILGVYNHDGPGMSSSVIKKNVYKKMIKKVHTYVPQSSVIGRLLYHEEQYTVIESTQSGLMQHDLYSWQVLGNKFISLDDVTNGSEMVDKVIKSWLDGVTPKQRAEFVNILYQILCATDAETLSELGGNWFKNAGKLLKAYKTTNEESKKIISQTLSAILNLTKESIMNSFTKPTIQAIEEKNDNKK